MLFEIEREEKHHKHENGAAPDATLKWRWHMRGKPEIRGVSREPLLDACRQIKSLLGSTPDDYAAIYRKDHETWDARCSVDWGAAHTVRDPDKGSIHFAKYEPFKR